MSDSGLLRLTAADLRTAFRTRRASPVELIDALAEHVERAGPALGAFTTLSLDRARDEALAAERAYRRGRAARPLEGLPLAVKDLIDTGGIRTTYGSSMFADHVPQRDATVVRRAREAGAIVVGKTTTHEFAWGITTDNPHYGPCRNPWRTDRVPGGSSGGSAVAVAALGVPLALGTDTGGSVRIPASFCGVVGLKPTFGAHSKAGVFPLARSLDHVGVLAAAPGDAALLAAALAGPDPADPVTRGVPAPIPLPASLSDLRVGWSLNGAAVVPVPEVAAAIRWAAEGLGELGAQVTEVDLPDPRAAGRAFVAIQGAEAHAAHRRAGLFPARAREYGPDVRGRLERGAAVDVAAYLAALEERDAVRAAMHDLFAAIDVLVTPVASGPPARHGAEADAHADGAVPFRLLVMPNTILQNLAGLPACTVRAGFDRDGLPVGVQITAAAGADALVVAVAAGLHALDPELQARRPPSRPTEEVRS